MPRHRQSSRTIENMTFFGLARYGQHHSPHISGAIRPFPIKEKKVGPFVGVGRRISEQGSGRGESSDKAPTLLADGWKSSCRIPHNLEFLGPRIVARRRWDA